LKNIPQLLTLPGNGVFTVHTGKEKKERLNRAYYGSANPDVAQKKWLASLAHPDTTLPWLLGVPSDNGGGIQRGANWGPLAVRQELLGSEAPFFDLGDVRVIPHLLHDDYLNDKTIKLCQRALYGKASRLPVSPLSIAERALQEIYRAHPAARILGVGGDHSVSYPLVKEWLASRRDLSTAAVLHFDAHTDLLERRLGIAHCFATWTRQILAHLESTEHIVQVGIRSSGRKKKFWKEETGVEQLWAAEVHKLGAEKTAQKIALHYRRLGIEELYISFDIDALDIRYAAATGTPEAGGLLPSDCAAIIRVLAGEFKVSGADLMEVAPYVLPEGVPARDQAASLSVAGDFARLLLEVLA
jgi:agmatinase